MAERILSEETINTFREYLVLEEKSTATVEKYLRDVRAFHLSACQQAVTKERMMAYKKYLIEKGYAASSINSITQRKRASVPRLLIRKHKKVSKINVFKGREHGTKSKNLILTGRALIFTSVPCLSPRHRQPPYGVFSYPCLYPPENCIN